MSAASAAPAAGRLSLCQVCFEPGHCYRNCNHPYIELTHQQGIEHTKRFMLANSNLHLRSNMEDWVKHLSRGMMRVLLTRYAEPSIKRDFNSIREWREWREAQNANDGPLYIPARVAIHGNATMEELRYMIDIVYTSLVKEIILTDINLIDIMAANDHIAQMRNAFIVFRRNLINPNISGQGVQNYALDMIDYLQGIIHQQENHLLAPPIPVPVLQDTYLNPPMPLLINVPMPQHPSAMMMVDVHINIAELHRQHRREPTFTIDLRLHNSVSSAAAAAAASTEPVQCGICWDEVNDECRMVTNCNHNFCNVCITSQLDTIRKKHQSSGENSRYLDLNCALCRQNVHTLSHNMTNDSYIQDVKGVLYRTQPAPATQEQTQEQT